jgi:hypothetical protein
LHMLRRSQYPIALQGSRYAPSTPNAQRSACCFARASPASNAAGRSTRDDRPLATAAPPAALRRGGRKTQFSLLPPQQRPRLTQQPVDELPALNERSRPQTMLERARVRQYNGRANAGRSLGRWSSMSCAKRQCKDCPEREAWEPAAWLLIRRAAAYLPDPSRRGTVRRHHASDRILSVGRASRSSFTRRLASG